jgi:hypothetical protein
MSHFAVDVVHCINLSQVDARRQQKKPMTFGVIDFSVLRVSRYAQGIPQAADFERDVVIFARPSPQSGGRVLALP